MPPKSHSFTAKAPSIANVLTSEVHVGESHLVTEEPGQQHLFQAIWDTGATNSVITKTVADQCGLLPIGMAQVTGVHGVKTANVYLVSIKLPNGAHFNQVRVTEGEIGTYHVLIGMDIIAVGDFAVTNAKGETWFTYRVPSRDRTCYVTQDAELLGKRNDSGRNKKRSKRHKQYGKNK